MGKMPPQFLRKSGANTPQTTSPTSDTMMPAPAGPMNAGSHASREAALVAAMHSRHKKVMGGAHGKGPMVNDTDKDGN